MVCLLFACDERRNDRFIDRCLEDDENPSCGTYLVQYVVRVMLWVQLDPRTFGASCLVPRADAPKWKRRSWFSFKTRRS